MGYFWIFGDFIHITSHYEMIADWSYDACNDNVLTRKEGDGILKEKGVDYYGRYVKCCNGTKGFYFSSKN